MKLLVAIGFLVVLAIAPAARADMLGVAMLDGPDAPSGPLVGLGLFAGAPTNSYTRVREGSLRGTYLDIDEESDEDGNLVGVFTHGASFALTYVF